MKRQLGIVVVAVTVACGDPVDPGVTDGPDPGFVAVSVSATGQNAGAVWLTITGSGFAIDSIRTSGLTLFSATISANEQRVILAGTIPNGEVMRFWVPDRGNLSSYQAVLNEAAAAGSYQQLAASGFVVSLMPLGS